jgi:hypothetical protein
VPDLFSEPIVVQSSLRGDGPALGKPRIGRILIARGRDAADVAISTTFGANTLKRFEVRTDEVTAEDEPAAARVLHAVDADR